MSWIALLAQMSDQHATLMPGECARHAHAAEVLEFGEPGGMMDHYATACGGGCMFAYAPDRPEPVAEAIAKAGGIPFVITADAGVRCTTRVHD